VVRKIFSSLVIDNAHSLEEHIRREGGIEGVVNCSLHLCRATGVPSVIAREVTEVLVVGAAELVAGHPCLQFVRGGGVTKRAVKVALYHH